MVFSSHIFLFYFLPAALLLYYLVPRRGKHLLLTFISYGFYGWTNPLFMGLMLFSTLVDYVCGLLLAYDSFRWNGPIDTLDPAKPRTRFQRTALVISLTSNLCLLGFFKYFNFGVENINWLAGALGLPWLRLDLAFKVTLPLGISFYTFQSMSYAIDVYRGEAKAMRSFIDFACYVSMFPQLVAGPIIRFQDVADQLVQRTYTFAKFSRGV
ncbi:MAG: MBOAT family protein, partial [Kiritimatiellia bacterium]